VNRLDKWISWISPAWGLRRKQLRRALERGSEPEPQKRPEGGGWLPLDDPRNPLSQANLSRRDAVLYGRSSRRPF
jgi:hypothetical protein